MNSSRSQPLERGLGSDSLRRRFLIECQRRGWSLSEARRLERYAKNPAGPAYLWLPGVRP